LALSSGPAGSTGTGHTDGQYDLTHFVQSGDTWLEVPRGPDGVEVIGTAKTPPLRAPRASGLFDAFVDSYPTGSWPEAVAIGDVNGDGLNDVVLVT
jgi:hypothetical protein